jgi:hypothetical protein
MNQQQIDHLVTRVKELTEQAQSSPKGLESVAQILGGHINVYSTECGLMRGIAERVLPSNWDFQTMSTVSGKCVLVVTGINRE